MARDFSLRAIISAVDKVSGPMKRINKSLRGPIKAMQDVNNAARGLGGAVGGLVGPLGLGAGSLFAGIGFGAASVMRTSAQFERFEAQLRTLEGSSEKAKESMSWITTFAAKTPYELTEVTQAFTQLKNYGLDPTDGTLKMLGDTAAMFAGKTMTDAIEMYGDAIRGENERLKEFGVVARKVGDEIIYSYDQGGKAMEVRAKANSASIQKALTSIFSSKYGGGMDELSKTWDGMWSNMMDSFAKVQKAIGDAGFFDFMKEQLTGFLGVLDTMEQNGTLKVWAKEVSDGLVALVKPVSQLLFGYQRLNEATGEMEEMPGLFKQLPDILRGIKSFVLWADSAAQSIGGWQNVAIGLGAVLAGPLIASIFDVGMAIGRLGFVLMTTPVGWFLAAVAAIAGAAYLIYKNWDGIAAWWSAKLDAVKAAFAGGWFDGIMELFAQFNPWRIWWEAMDGLMQAVFGWDIGAILSQKLSAAYEALPAWAQELISGVGGVLSIGDQPGNAPAADAVPAAAAGVDRQALRQANRAELNGDLTVRFENAPPGTRVNPGKTNQRGVALNPDVGYRSMVMPS